MSAIEILVILGLQFIGYYLINLSIIDTWKGFKNEGIALYEDNYDRFMLVIMSIFVGVTAHFYLFILSFACLKVIYVYFDYYRGEWREE